MNIWLASVTERSILWAIVLTTCNDKLLTCFDRSMDKILSAIKQLLEAARLVSWSKLANIKRVYYGDPITVPLSSLPALIVRPRTSTFILRWSRYDEKQESVEIVLVYNQSQYYNSFKGSPVAISNAVRATSTVTMTTSAAHGLTAGDDITIEGMNPSGYNGTYKVATAPTGTTLTYVKSTDPGIFVAWGTVRADNVEKVFAVENAVLQVWSTDNNQSTQEGTICGTIQKNTTLPYVFGGNTINTAAIAKVESVDYTFSTTRGFPTYEVIVWVLARVVADR